MLISTIEVLTMTKPLSIEELKSDTARKIASDLQAAALDQPAYPPEEPEAKPTLAERWAEFWRNRRIKQLRAKIQREEKLIESMPEAITRARAEADEEHQLRLREISSLAAFHVAEARHEILQAEAALYRLGAR
jgi:hypothetical protein